MCKLTRARAVPGFFIVAVAVAHLLSQQALADPDKGPPQDIAADAVREALQREVYGLDGDRLSLLSAAAREVPDYAPLRWQQGYVRGQRSWIRAEDLLQTPKLADRLSQYERERAKTADSVEGQWALAEWCHKHKLLDQQRAHLTRIIDLSPDHPAARAALGFVRQGGGWVAREQFAREAAQETARAAAIKEWTPKLAEIRRDLEHRSQERREFALGKLNAIVHPAAIPAIEAVFADAPAAAAVAAFDALLGFDDPEASLALARFAIFSPDLEIREAAANRLGKRELDSYVPQLLATMYSPVVSQFMAVNMPNGRIGYRHAFAREGQDQRQVMVLDTEYRRIPLIGGSRAESASRAFDDAAQTAQQLELAANQQNQRTNAWNDRLGWVLKTATQQNLPAQPELWWKWWNDHNEVYVIGEKPTSVLRDARQVAIEDYVPEEPTGPEESEEPEESTGSGGGTRVTGGRRSWRGNNLLNRGDCLVAGTVIWTIRGPNEVERIRVGDLVLSQHPDTGELAYKPVLRTTIRPKGPLTRVEAGGDSIITSGGHLFWVAGQGWVKSRNLKSGQVLHTTKGSLHVSIVEPAPAAETYNLVVADFSTYFVGYGQVLSHDNTVRQPTRALVPGLAAQ